VFKGQKMPGRLGGKRRTQVGLTVHSTDPERTLILVKGAVPGPKGSLVVLRSAAKRALTTDGEA
jgi:large subunit ribosomal protein L3